MLVPVSSDPDSPAILTPAMLLTQKANQISAPKGDFDKAELLSKQWKHVQALADTFWKRWKTDYLSTLQSRRKWTMDRPDVKEGDVVIIKDAQAHRNDWPIGLVTRTFPSKDKKTRKVEIRSSRDGVTKLFLRPISEVVILFSEES